MGKAPLGKRRTECVHTSLGIADAPIAMRQAVMKNSCPRTGRTWVYRPISSWRAGGRAH